METVELSLAGTICVSNVDRIATAVGHGAVTAKAAHTDCRVVVKKCSIKRPTRRWGRIRQNLLSALEIDLMQSSDLPKTHRIRGAVDNVCHAYLADDELL